MLTSYKYLVIPILEYYSVLWNPTRVSQIQRIEEIQCLFLRKNKWGKSKLLEVLENIVPNINGIVGKENPHLGRSCSGDKNS